MSQKWISWLKNRINKSHRTPQTRRMPQMVLELEILEDRIVPANPILVTVTGDNGINGPAAMAGSLRAAIYKANTTPGPQTIDFVVPNKFGNNDFLVNSIPLPAIDNVVTINASASILFPLGTVTLMPGPKPPRTGSGLDFAAPKSIGSKLLGMTITGFAQDGIDIESNNVVIGGTAAREAVTLIKNKQNGIVIKGSGALIINCFIGTNSRSQAALGNGKDGIEILGSTGNNTIGGTAAGQRNVISNNGQRGIWINRSSGNKIISNYIGTTVNGQFGLGNGLNGITINGSSDTTIGGAAGTKNGLITSPMNVISSNGAVGVNIDDTSGGTSAGSSIQGNFIGTDLTGNAPLGNGKQGIVLASTNSITIGGAGAGQANVISDNGDDGIDLLNNTTKVTMTNNYISTGLNIKLNLFNGGKGIYADATTSRNNAGGNKGIWNNKGGGYNDVSKKNHLFDPNSVYDNSGGWPDGSGIIDGPNGDLNGIPIISSATVNPTGTGIIVSGSLYSTPNTYFVIEFFGNQQEDPSGYGQGQTWLGETAVSTDPNGNASFSNVQLPAVAGPYLSATATDPSPSGDTSQFAKDYLLSGLGPTSGVGGNVWDDTNGNGLMDSGEKGIANVLVQLFPSGGDAGPNTGGYTTYTDANGNYSFTNLTPGSYYLQFTAPPGYSFTASYQGEDQQDSHADPYTGQSETFSLYAGQYDPYFAAGMIATSSLPTTTTTLTSDENPSAYGDSVDFTATVTQSDSVPLGGTVSFMDGHTLLGSSVLEDTSNGYEAMFSDSALSVGTHSITAVYNGDGFHVGSSSTALSQTVQQGYTLTSFVTSANPALPNQNVTFTAEVDAFGSSEPTGSVTFYDGSTELGSSQLSVVNGVDEAVFSSASLALGLHTITATYNGDNNYLGSTVSATQVISNEANSSVTLTSSSNPAIAGQTVTYTATVSGSSGTPTGIVIFEDDGSILGTATVDGSGQAIFSTAALAVGSQTITALYSGDATYGDSAAFLTQTVNLSATTSSLTSSVNPSQLNQSVTFTDTVTPQGNSATPTGNVTFLDGTTILGTGTLALVGGLDQATFSTSSLTGGTHTITAVYDGDDNYSGSDAFVSQIVGSSSGLSSTTTIASSANPVLAGQSVTFTATVSGAGSPTGTVTFLDGETILGTGTLSLVNGQEQATYTTSTLGFGTHEILAVYSGDSTFASSAAAMTQQINQGSSSTTLASSANPASSGQSVTFTATVSGANFTPTGTVLFQDGTTVLGTATLAVVNGQDQASFSISTLALGTHAINVIYTGDSNFSSSGAWLQQSITQSGAAAAVRSSSNASVRGQTSPSTSPSDSSSPRLPQSESSGDSVGQIELPLLASLNQMVSSLLVAEEEWIDNTIALVDSALANWQSFDRSWAFSIQSFFSRQQQALHATEALFGSENNIV